MRIDKDKIWQTISKYMPKKLVYFCSIRLMAHATTGKYSDTVVSDLDILTALKRWEIEI